MVSIARLSTLQAMNWLRQKTRTASTPTEAQGEWTDQVVVDQLNAAIREVVTRMMAVPWCPYFLNYEINQTTVGGTLQAGLSAGEHSGVIKVAFVQRTVAVEHPDKGKLLRPMSLNRFVHTAIHGNPKGLLKVNDPELFYFVRQLGAHSTPPNPVLLIQLFNNVGEMPLDVAYYALPPAVTAPALGSEFIGLPPIAWNAALAYALMLLVEDEENQTLYQWAKDRFHESMESVIAAMHLHHDMPDTLVAGVNTDNT